MLPTHRRYFQVIFVMLFLCAGLGFSSVQGDVIVNRSFYNNSTVDVQNGTTFTVRLDYTINSTVNQEFVYIAEKLPAGWSIIDQWYDPFLEKDLSDFDVSATTGYQGENSSTGEYEWAFADIYPLWDLESKGVPSGYLTYDVMVPGNAILGQYNISGKWRSVSDIKNIVDLDNKTYDFNASADSRGNITNSTVNVSTNDTVGPYIYNVTISEFSSTDSDTYIEVGEGVKISFKVNDSSGVNTTSVYIDNKLINTTNATNDTTISVTNTTLVTKGLRNVSIVAIDNNSKTSFKNFSFFVYNEYIYWNKLDAITLMLADKSGHSDDGNWLILQGGYPELLPADIDVITDSVSYDYPFADYKVYTNISGQNEVTATLKVSPAFKNQNVTIWRIKIPNSSKAFDISFDKLLNETLTDYDTETFTLNLDDDGDANVYNNKIFESGSYIILVTSYDNPNNDTSAMGILGFNFITVLEYDSYVDPISTVVVGQSFKVTMNLVNASQQNYTYTSILLNNEDYETSSSPGIDISFEEGTLKINGEDCSNYSGLSSILELVSPYFATNKTTVNATNASLIVQTNSSWPISSFNYRLINLVYSNDSSNRSAIAYNSTIVSVIPDTVPPVASIYTPSYTVDEDVEVWFNANNSTDNVNIVNYSWDLDGVPGVDKYGLVLNWTYPDPGSYTITLNVTDAAGNYALISITIQVLDATSPIISNVSNGTASNYSVSISWDTNELSNSTVRYGLDTNISNMSLYQSDSTFVLNHTIVLFNLTNDTKYYYMVNSSDQLGNSNNSTISNFNTTNNTDNDSPIISNAFLDKNTNLKIGNIITVTVNVSDNIGVTRVTAGGTNLTRQNATHWKRTVTADATKSITIYAYDAAGNNNSTILTYTLYVAYYKPPSTGGGGGGGGGTSGEEFENILCSEVDRQFVGVDQEVSYSFEFDCNYVKYINLTGIASSGKIAAKVETLNHTSSLVDIPAPDIVFKNVNVWAGNMGWFSENNVKDPTIMFMVDRTWVKNNNIKLNTITFYSYNDGTANWEKMSTQKISEDSGSYYFEASLPIRGTLGPMAISGRSSSASVPHFPTIKPTITPQSTPEIVPGATPVTWTGIWKEEVPGFQVLMALFVLIALYVSSRRRN